MAARWTSTAGMQAQSASNNTAVETLNAPRYGTVVPKRIFVGGISASTTEAELHQLFSRFGVVANAKIISDRAGVSKGYGFVTFDSEEAAQRAQASASNVTLRDRRLNIAPAIKKQPFTRVYDPTQCVPNGTVLYHNGIPYTYHNGMAFFVPPEAVCQTYPVIYQPYYPQRAFQYQNVVASQWNPWRWNASSNGPSPYCGNESPEYYDPAIIEASAEVGGHGALVRKDAGDGAAGTLWAAKSSTPRRQRRYTAPPSFVPSCDGAQGGQRGSGDGMPDCYDAKWHWRDCLFAPSSQGSAVCP